VMSAWGRAEAAQRWHDGDHGPRAQMAQSTKRVCRDCGFLLPLAGSLGVIFGVCGNELSADGHIVDFEYGCGAHSDTPAPAGSGSPMYDPFDDGVLEISEKPAEAPVEEPIDEPAEPAAEVPTEEIAAEIPAGEPDEPVDESGEQPAELVDEPAEVATDEPVEPS
jgi:hypothetical protein